jgi:hypothetical protein
MYVNAIMMHTHNGFNLSYTSQLRLKTQLLSLGILDTKNTKAKIWDLVLSRNIICTEQLFVPYVFSQFTSFFQGAGRNRGENKIHIIKI